MTTEDSLNTLSRKSKLNTYFFKYSVLILNCNFRLDDRHIRGANTNSDLKLPPESDTDSIQDYVDGETAGIIDFSLVFFVYCNMACVIFRSDFSI